MKRFHLVSDSNYIMQNLYENVTSTSFALDLGGIYKAKDNLAFGISLKDVGAKYEWQTSQILRKQRNTTRR